jgi:hypothetical protein
MISGKLPAGGGSSAATYFAVMLDRTHRQRSRRELFDRVKGANTMTDTVHLVPPKLVPDPLDRAVQKTCMMFLDAMFTNQKVDPNDPKYALTFEETAAVLEHQLKQRFAENAQREKRRGRRARSKR